MRFEIDNIYTGVYPETTEEQDALVQALFFVHGYFYRCPRRKKTVRDEKKILLLERGTPQRFLTGLLPLVLSKLKAWGFPKPVLVDRRIRPQGVPYAHDWSLLKRTKGFQSLRPYQTESVEIAILMGRGYIVIGTRGGKTAIMGELTFRLGVRTLILVSDKEMLYQVYTDLDDASILQDIGIIGDGKFRLEDITVALPHTIAKRMEKDEALRDWLSQIEMLIVDECHSIKYITKDSMIIKIAKQCPAYYRFGFTATEHREGSLHSAVMQSMLGAKLYDKNTKKLIAEGYVAQGCVTMPSYQHARSYKNWEDARITGIINNAERNQLILQMTDDFLTLRQSGLLIGSYWTEQTQLLYNLLITDPRFTGKVIEYTDGEMGSNPRQDILTRFEQGDIHVVVSTLYKKGVDLKAMKGFLNASAGKDPIPVQQRANRPLTLDEGKPEGFIYDIMDDDGGGMLRRQALARKRTYQEQGFNLYLNLEGTDYEDEIA